VVPYVVHVVVDSSQASGIGTPGMGACTVGMGGHGPVEEAHDWYSDEVVGAVTEVKAVACGAEIV
jgi:hypothetical protein